MSSPGGEKWPEPVQPTEAAPDPWPVKALPEVLGLWVTELAAEVEVDPTMAICAALASCSLTVTRKGRIALSHEGDAWRQPLNSYWVPVAYPSERKSPIYEAAIEPILDRERRLAATWRRERALADEHIKELEERQRSIRARLGKSKKKEQPVAQQELLPAEPVEPEDLRGQLEAATRELVEAREALPRPPEMLISDVHPHTLARHLDEVGGVSGVFTDEGDGPFSLLTDGRETHFGCWLPGYDGSWSRTKRKDAKFSGAPHLAALVFCQPALLNSLGSRPAAHGLGFTARWWYGVCDTRAGRRTNRTQPMRQTTREGWKVVLGNLLQLPRPDTEPVLLLSSEARDVFLGWRDELEQLQAAEHHHPALSQWLGKHAARVGRLAGVLHLVGYACEPGGGLREEVSRWTVESAIQLGRAAVGHARAAFGLMAMDETSELAVEVLDFIRRRPAQLDRSDKRGPTVTVRSLLGGLHRRVPGREILDPVLCRLVDWGWLRSVNPERTPDMQVSFLIHPCLSASAASPQLPQMEAGFS